jgi:hypothetical protein
MSNKIEFGDFQTPLDLARRCCELLKQVGCHPRMVVEPTCGVGSFLQAASLTFEPEQMLGFDINPDHVKHSKAVARREKFPAKVEVADFFKVEWSALVAAAPSPVLVVGNPPWVTNAVLSAMGSTNLPDKANSYGLSGMDALTGKSNFDVSEWMILRLMEALEGRNAWLAFLIKTSVARKALEKRWRAGARFAPQVYRIDGKQEFDVSVDACLLVVRFDECSDTCSVFPTLDARVAQTRFGLVDDRLVADVVAYRRWSGLATNSETTLRWRSGVKHDCSAVMELKVEGKQQRNGLGEVVDLEPDHLYPMLKSSEVAKDPVPAPRRVMIVTQKTVGESTDAIPDRTRAYLERHAALLDGRRSTIYRDKPRFSVFGVGPYSFLPWKVAISGFYKSFRFSVVGPCGNKPIVFDDTVYFLSFSSSTEALLVAQILNSDPAQSYLRSLVFWDAKRPVTTDLLRHLSIQAVADALGQGKEWKRMFAAKSDGRPITRGAREASG